MATPTSKEPAAATSSGPSILSYSRAQLSAAKAKKSRYWYAEILAAMLSVGASLAPWVKIAAIVGVLSVATKVWSKVTLAAAKRLFRSGERARRYDFYTKSLGWPLPPNDRADMVVANSSSAISDAARKLAGSESDYYAHKGVPSTERLFCNLAESMFWTERLLGFMAKVRWKHVALAALAVIAVLVGTVVIQPTEGAFVALKFLGTVVALLVAVDVLGEAQSFERGEREAGRLLSALTTEMARPSPSREEGLRLLAEYNCLLADLPLLPDSIYDKYRDVLNAAWSAFEASLPFRCNAPPVESA